MDLQKLHSSRVGLRRTVSILLEKLEETKENGTLLDFNTLLKTLETKVVTLTSVNEQIQSQTDADGIEENMVETDIYTIELDLKLNRLRDFQRLQQTTIQDTTQQTTVQATTFPCSMQQTTVPGSMPQTTFPGTTQQTTVQASTPQTTFHGSTQQTFPGSMSETFPGVMPQATFPGSMPQIFPVSAPHTTSQITFPGSSQQMIFSGSSQQTTVPDHVQQMTAHPIESTQHGIFQYRDNPLPPERTFSSFSSASSQFHRLPKLTLPRFNGDMLQWQTFWDSFESTVHLNTSLTDIQKFNYLKAQLEGDAARTLDGFPLTNANYVRALDLLKERFGRPHKIVNAYMQALLDIPVPSNNLYSLRGFQDKMEAYVRGLESLGQCQKTYGNLLVPVIMGKLPPEIKRNLAREHGDNWILSDLRRAFNKEITIIEAGQQQQQPGTIGAFDSTASFYAGATQRNRHNNDRRPARPPPKTTGHRKDGNTYTCIFCDGSHTAKECKKITSVETRREIVKNKQLCFNCLRKHYVSQCKSSSRCIICKRKHHTSICNQQTASGGEANFQQPVPGTSTDTAILHTTTQRTRPGVLLKTAIATVSYGTVHVEANILFDEGAQRSFITEELACKLHLIPDGTEEIRLSSFGSSKTGVQHLNTSTVYLVTDRKEKIPIPVLIVPMIATPINNRVHSTASQLPYLRGLKLAHPITDDDSFSISLLIGADHYWKIVEDRIVRGIGPTAVKSKIGYLLSGPIHDTKPENHSTNVLNVITSHRTEEAALEKFWSLESMGIISDETDKKSSDSYLQEYQANSITFNGERYVAMLPWKQDHPSLPKNYNVTKRRTESTIRRLREDPHILQKYSEIITDQEKRGFIEKISEDSNPHEPPHQVVHYIPHHPVKKDSTTTPVRIVYDCSCRQSRDLPSLNDCLQSIPPILNDLSCLLVRFRLNPVAVTTDIEKAFLQVGLHEKDRDATRFFWLSDPKNPDSQLCTYRFKTVLFGATSSPFILNATILKHLELNNDALAADILRRDLYVDNVLSSFEHDSEALAYFRNARDLMLKAGFNLRSWTSNSPSLRAVAAREWVLDKDAITKVLGMQWTVQNDLLSFAPRDIPHMENITKRFILRHSSRIYDPLGFLSPVTIRAKILMQLIWKQKYDWDIPLPDDIQEVWSTLADDINEAVKISFPRGYFVKTNDTHLRKQTDEITLHVFVDASIQSYGATAYLCNGKESAFVMAKNRVAPIKPLSLPELELMAAVIGARLTTHLQNALPVSTVVLWSDSQIVLHWMVSAKPQKRFVRNRVIEIKKLTANYIWKYCPTNDNPADLLTRGIRSTQFTDNKLWCNGPVWLTDKSKWPKWDVHGSSPGITANQGSAASPRSAASLGSTASPRSAASLGSAASSRSAASPRSAASLGSAASSRSAASLGSAASSRSAASLGSAASSRSVASPGSAESTGSPIRYNATTIPTTTVLDVNFEIEYGIHKLIDVTRYNKYSQLLRVTAYVRRFISNCRVTKACRLHIHPTVKELHEAEMIWIKCCQSTTYSSEISNMKSKGNRLPIVKQLRLFLDGHGYIRCGGRIHNAPLEDITKFPFLLPRKHPLTTLIVLHAHQNMLHAGVNATITHLRQKFWIPAIRQYVRSTLRKCVKCLKICGRPYRTQDPPPLPKVRVEDSPPFTVTGVDFTGALYLKEKTGTETKAYICLFTCATTRAVHLEIVHNLTEEAFMNAFRRFSSRKSLPRVMMSDNATTYIAASEHLRRLFESPTLQESLNHQGTEWRFIPKRAPWYGGWWERLIGMTKTTLKKILGRNNLNMEALQTVITEIEATMNDRPLTHVSSDPDDMEPLTPAHLLYGRRIKTLPYTEDLEECELNPTSNRATINIRAKSIAQVIEQSRRRWKFEYLTALREHHMATGSEAQSIHIGDVVQIYDDRPRVQWKLGVVEELLTGNDGITRAVKLRTNSGHTTRPVKKLYPLEVTHINNIQDLCRI